MMEVIVTNEFTQMNAGPERRPFKVLTPPERSSAMVIARYSNRQQRAMRAGAAQTEDASPDLLWKALRVGSVCAACAFAFFFLSQRNLFERVGETLGRCRRTRFSVCRSRQQQLRRNSHRPKRRRRQMRNQFP